VHTDTVVEYTALLDGVTIKKDNLTVEVLRIRDSIYINGSCDTIFIEKIITRNIPIKYYKENEINYNWLFLILALFLAYYIFFKK
jgi:hypothetical protein